MRRLLVLLLVLTTDLPAWSEGERIGAKAMFQDPSLNVIHFSPQHQAEPHPGRKEGNKQESQKRRAGPGTPRASAPRAVPEALPEDPVLPIGIRVWVQQVDHQGKVLSEAAVGRVFRSGERIQLIVESNTDGYLAVVQQGADGRAGLLFPSRESELGTHRVRAHDKVVLPGGRSSFTFDQTAGTERLLIILARDRQELAALPLQGEMALADLSVIRRFADRERGAKNLIVQAFADPLKDPALYAVNLAGSAVVQEIALVHEK